MRFRSLFAACLLVCAIPLFGIASAEPDATLAEAAMHRDIATVRSLLAKKAEVNATGSDGTTALEWMIRIDDIDTTKMLLAAGADPNKANRLGVTPIALATANGNTEIIRLLLDKGVAKAVLKNNRVQSVRLRAAADQSEPLVVRAIIASANSTAERTRTMRGSIIPPSASRGAPPRSSRRSGGARSPRTGRRTS